MAWVAVCQAARSVLDRAAEEQVSLVVRGIEYECWRCQHQAVPCALIHPVDQTDPLLTIETVQDLPLHYARELLVLSSSPVAATATIKVRHSKTRGDAYLSNGCSNCDALFGAFPLQEAITSAEVNGTIGSLPVLATMRRPVVEWWALLCNRDNLWWDS